MITTLSDSVLSVIFPRKCVVCGGGVEHHAAGPACARCWAETRIFALGEPLCEKCGAPLFERSGTAYLRCGECREHEYERAFSVGIYEKALAAVIVSLKREPHIPRRLVEEIGRVIDGRPEIGEATVLIPVPLSRQRLRERGFNQASVVAQLVSKFLNVRVDEHSVGRSTHTHMHRGLMDRKAREASVAKAFEVLRPRLISGERVLLVDDVFTTGSTVSACAAVLKKAGAESVNVFTLARAIKKF